MGIKYQGDVDFQGAVTMPNLGIDNIALNGNTISSTSGNVAITPVAGSAVVIDGHLSIDGAAVTSLTNNNTTVTAYAGKAVVVESVSMDGGVVTGVTTLTGASLVGTSSVKVGVYNATPASSTETIITPSYDAVVADTVITVDGYVTPIGIGVPGGQVKNYKFVLDKATSQTAAAAWTGSIITCSLASGAYTFTLPAASAALNGYHLKIMQTTDNDFIVTGVAGNLCTRNNATATTVTFSTANEKLGAAVEVFCNSTKWFLMNVSDCTMVVS